MDSDSRVGFLAVPIPKKLNFIGRSLTFSETYFRYAAARAVFDPEAAKTIKRMYANFDDRIGYLDNFVSDGYSYLMEQLSPLLDFTVSQLAANGCYGLSKEEFLKKYVDNKTDGIAEIYTAMEQAYNEMQERQRQRNEKRVLERKQAVAEGKSDLGERLWNGLQRAVDGGKNVMEALSIYTDEIQRRIKDEFSMLCNTMIDSFAEALWDTESIDLRNPTPEFGDEYKRAKTILNNLKNNNIPESRVDDAAFEALSLCPYLDGLLEWLLGHYGDEKGELQRISDAFCRPLDGAKSNLLEQIWNELNFDTEEAALASREKLQAGEKLLSYRSDEYHSKIEMILHDFDLKARTADGVEYRTREDAEKARILLQEYAKIDTSSLDACTAGREAFRAREKEFGLRLEKYENKLDEVIRDLDLRERTVDGVEYKTLEEAGKARKLLDVYAGIDTSTLESCQQGRNKFAALEKELDFRLAKCEKQLDELIKDLDLKARTVDGVEYKTLVEAAKARKLLDVYAKIDTSSLTGSLKGRDEFLALEKEQDFHLPEYEKKLEELVGGLDLKARTVDGVEYKTLDEAEEARRQYAALVNIIKDNGIDSEEHTQNIISNIESNAYTIPRAAKCREILQAHLEMLKFIPSGNVYKYIMSTPAKIAIVAILFLTGAMRNGDIVMYGLAAAFVVYIVINNKEKFFRKMQLAVQARKYKKAALFYELAKPSVEKYLGFKIDEKK